MKKSQDHIPNETEAINIPNSPQSGEAVISNSPGTINPACPCKRKCVRHGNCIECRATHEAEGKYPTCCQRIENRKRKKKGSV
ncbi:hypothetical protein V3C10_13890 [[Clostridium] symbiosum]|uniref:hypothetical protein n=1 Tax=Clostridium symbiosum TaxID=1512 RepID=UPI001D0950D9|nr:hypothetical protein [[Clostridium] symbiosum]MCB6608324.1 hypothetical protein [[Clostridium] symbiosum]MCB6932874.1 hypothetical protein [[Clostridium] symbiosum]